jgi:hypothetical protein
LARWPIVAHGLGTRLAEGNFGRTRNSLLGTAKSRRPSRLLSEWGSASNSIESVHAKDGREHGLCALNRFLRVLGKTIEEVYIPHASSEYSESKQKASALTGSLNPSGAVICKLNLSV